MAINFSFIIPHKNTPDLLQKCLDSIPRREDVQIIVVDDNSDADKVDFNYFPGVEDPTVEVYFTKEGRGAGYARNVGLEHTIGKWLVFADADDFFNPCIVQALDEFRDTKLDVVFFKGAAKKMSDGSSSNRADELNRRVDIAIRTGDCTLPLLYSSPCMKFFSRSFIKTNQITFNEVRWGNDVVFMAKVARFVEKCTASPMEIYCITESGDSLVSKKTIDSALVRLEQECQEVSIVRPRYGNEESIYYWLFQTWMGVYKLNRGKALLCLPKAIQAGGWGFIRQMIMAKFG